MRTELTGVGVLTRLALRRDRVTAGVWVYALGGLVFATVTALLGLYPTVPERLKFAGTITSNPSIEALTGRIFDPTTIGGLTAWRTATLVPTLLAIVNVLTVVRHTRAEEESGRAELVGSAPTGGLASLAAGLIAALVVDVGVALLSAAGLVVKHQAAAASIQLGVVFGLSGLVYAGVAAVAAQITTSARMARAIGGGFVAAGFLLRAVADSTTGASWLAWASPIGWVERTEAFGAGHWWTVLLFLGAVAGTVGVAVPLRHQRDLGSGLIVPGLGPGRAVSWLRTPEALAFRLHRASLLGWSIALTTFAALFGSIASGVTQLVNGSSQIRQIITRIGGPGAIIDTFLSAALSMIAIVVAAAVVQGVLRMSGEESDGRLEPLLATAVSRRRWMLAHLLMALATAVAATTMIGIAMGLTHGVQSHDVGGQLPRLIGAAFAHLPAALLVGAIAALAYSVRASLARVGWGVLVLSLVISQLGRALHLPDVIVDLSPFTHSPSLPGPTWQWTPILVLLGLTAAVTGAAVAVFERRDLG